MINEIAFPQQQKGQTKTNYPRDVYQMHAQDTKRNKPQAVYPFARKRNDECCERKHHINPKTEVSHVHVELKVMKVDVALIDHIRPITKQVQNPHTRLN